MPTRLLRDADVSKWVELRGALWPDLSRGEHETEALALLRGDPPTVVFVAELDDQVVGFLELGLRPFAEGCSSSPVPYVEGWYVAPGWRQRGVGGELMLAAEAWSRERGYVELGSDTEVANRVSRDAHAALGFEEVAEVVAFRKPL